MYFPTEVGRSESVVFYDPAWSVAAHWLYIPERSYAGLLAHYEQASTLTKVVPALGINVHNNAFKTVVSYPFMAYQESGFSDIKGEPRQLEKQFINAERGLRKAGFGTNRKTRKAAKKLSAF
jgi:hypothetical protein